MKRNGDALSKFIVVVVVRYFLCPIFIRPVIPPPMLLWMRRIIEIRQRQYEDVETRTNDAP